MNIQTSKATTSKATRILQEEIGGRLFTTVVWSHIGVAAAFLVLALLTVMHQHVGLTHFARGIMAVG